MPRFTDLARRGNQVKNDSAAVPPVRSAGLNVKRGGGRAALKFRNPSTACLIDLCGPKCQHQQGRRPWQTPGEREVMGAKGNVFRSPVSK